MYSKRRHSISWNNNVNNNLDMNIELEIKVNFILVLTYYVSLCILFMIFFSLWPLPIKSKFEIEMNPTSISISIYDVSLCLIFIICFQFNHLDWNDMISNILNMNEQIGDGRSAHPYPYPPVSQFVLFIISFHSNYFY